MEKLYCRPVANAACCEARAQKASPEKPRVGKTKRGALERREDHHSVLVRFTRWQIIVIQIFICGRFQGSDHADRHRAENLL